MKQGFFKRGIKRFWDLGIVRCVTYASIVAWGIFKSGTQGYDSLSEMTPLQFTYLFGDMMFAGVAGVVLAFIDQKLTESKPQTPTTAEDQDNDT